MIEIIKPEKIHYNQWARLMSGYFDFYNFKVNETHLTAIFEKICTGLIQSLLAFDGEGAVGVANYLFNHSTFYKLECYLSDLYIEKDYRGHNIAGQLMEKVFKHAKTHGCGNVNWLTATDNMVAQKIYDKVARKPNFIMYQHDL
ncbi:MAG: N-acetyltransferase [Burkholderiales bacterium]|jgi:GNAT superfamily N-acetyltransferase|nr:N-acetyltransferase [Burkholderiales bacterium]